ncbi:MAG: nucleotidyl transferase AbiEii/AbiGii toxin family protein [Myxococcota bacterium]
MTREYRTAAAFKQALEQRLRTASTSGIDFARRRQLVVFDRFLARIALELGDAVTLKGGLAVELRIERARTTKDVDLRVMGSPDDILDRLRAAATRDLGDFMVFTIRPDDRHPDIRNDGTQYDGRPNSRVQDLPDLALIATAGSVEASRLRAAIEQTFGFRRTHDAPHHLPAPPATWEGPHAAIAKEDQLR